MKIKQTEMIGATITDYLVRKGLAGAVSSI